MVEQSTLSEEELGQIERALERSLRKSMEKVTDKEAYQEAGMFIFDFVTRTKISYMLTTPRIRAMLEDYIAYELYCDLIEDMSVRFFAHLPNAASLRSKLVVAVAACCSEHSDSSMLPDDITENVVNYNDAKEVLRANGWLLFLATLVIYLDLPKWLTELGGKRNVKA